MFAVAGNMEEQAPRLVDVCPDVSPGLSDIIAKGLHKKISERYSSALDMKRDLEELMKSTYSNPGLPANWKDMSSPWQDVELVQLQTSSPEFKQVAGRFHQTCKEAEWRIVKVERVQNLPQLQLYETHKRMIESRQRPRGANEMQLFHGTDEHTKFKIDRNSFNRSFCGKNATAYGQGVYFAVKASYSISDTYSRPDEQGNKYMYLARVLAGEFCKGDSSMRMPPPQSSESDLLLYDSTVDRLEQPSMHVVYHDAQAYPEYLITIRRA
jgi:poly [ADP-ribose] polymerase 10/14/15